MWLAGIAVLVVLGIIVTIFGEFFFPPAGRLFCLVVVLTPFAVIEGTRRLINCFRAKPPGGPPC